MTLLQHAVGANELPDLKARPALCDASRQLHPNIIPRFAASFELLSEGKRQLVLGSRQMIRPLAKEQRRTVAGSISLTPTGNSTADVIPRNG